MNATRAVERVVVTEGDHQVASQVGLHLLGDLADRAGLSSAYSAAVPWAGERAPGQDRGRLFAQVAVMLAGGGCCLTDMAAVRELVDGLVARNVEFSVYARVNDQLSAAIRAVPTDAWARAVRDDGEARHAGEVAELDVTLAGWPVGTRVICRREKPHPGAQLRLWDTDGYRHQVTLTNSAGDALALELRQRRHAPGGELHQGAARHGARPHALRAASPPTRRGSSSCSPPPTCWPGGWAASTGRWPGPNPRPCATGCCTWPPASCAVVDASCCGSRSTGRGPRSSPAMSLILARARSIR